MAAGSPKEQSVSGPQYAQCMRTSLQTKPSHFPDVSTSACLGRAGSVLVEVVQLSSALYVALQLCSERVRLRDIHSALRDRNWFLGTVLAYTVAT